MSRPHWNRKDRLSIMDNLAMYLSAGLSAVHALELISQGLRAKRKRESLRRAVAAIESGRNVSLSLAAEIGLPSTVVGLIACGESSGNLADTVRASQELLEREDELIKRCLSAMAYPALIGAAAFFLTIGLMRGIMPQITPLFAGLHADLPALTRIVMAISDLLMKYGAIGIIIAVSVSIAAVTVYRKFGHARLIVHSIIGKAPIIGSLVRRYALAIFCQSLGALVGSGASTDVAFNETAESIGFIPLRKRLKGRSAMIARGGSLSAALERDAPPYVSSIVAAGEASGNLGPALVRAAILLDRELDHSMKSLTSLVEPAMMIVMGSIVGTIALSIMMPIYGISKTIQH